MIYNHNSNNSNTNLFSNSNNYIKTKGFAFKSLHFSPALAFLFTFLGSSTGWRGLTALTNRQEAPHGLCDGELASKASLKGHSTFRSISSTPFLTFISYNKTYYITYTYVSYIK